MKKLFLSICLSFLALSMNSQIITVTTLHSIEAELEQVDLLVKQFFSEFTNEIPKHRFTDDYVVKTEKEILTFFDDNKIKYEVAETKIDSIMFSRAKNKVQEIKTTNTYKLPNVTEQQIKILYDLINQPINLVALNDPDNLVDSKKYEIQLYTELVSKARLEAEKIARVQNRRTTSVVEVEIIQPVMNASAHLRFGHKKQTMLQTLKISFATEPK